MIMTGLVQVHFILENEWTQKRYIGIHTYIVHVHKFTIQPIINSIKINSAMQNH